MMRKTGFFIPSRCCAIAGVLVYLFHHLKFRSNLSEYGTREEGKKILVPVWRFVF